MTANRNHGIRTASSDYILLLDDDVEMDRAFVGCALRAARRVPKGLFFPTIWEDGIPILPNGLDLLGFSTRIYAPGERYHTANCQCILMPRALALEEPWDEVISGYGYEEMDYGYRIAAQGHPLIALPQCVCTHLAPNVNRRFRIGPDANRLYVAMKRHFLIDRNLTRGLAFLALGLPHHVLARVKRNGLRGIGEAFSNFRLATSLIRRHIRDAA
jgi:GT2 family glycosyltransferase